jgi:hypothetical protein
MKPAPPVTNALNIIPTEIVDQNKEFDIIKLRYLWRYVDVYEPATFCLNALPLDRVI